MRPRRASARALLKHYNRKRDFGLTAEPRGTAPRERGHSYVIQQHDATRMHYDFRLELDGVLKSWAVPKGPSLSPKEKRLAVQTEDHPISYRDFEGNIPEGQYGGGPVIVWDRGTWTPDEEPHRALDQGALRFSLHGEKLQGAFSLVRLKGEPGPKSNWLLIKRSDEHVREGRAAEPTQQLIKSVISGKTVKQIGKDLDAPRWHSNRPAAKKAAPLASGKSRMPALDDLDPQLATLVERAPDGDAYGYEIKFDGYRVLAALDGGTVKLRSRNKLDWTGTFKTVTRELGKLKVRQAILDGELCYVEEDGKTHFQRLQNVLRPQHGSGTFDHGRIVLFVFDLLFLDGADLRKLPLTQRKARLEKLLGREKGVVRLSTHLTGDAAAIFKQVCELGLEGVIGKRLDGPYREGRGRDWIKLKCNQRQEFVIVGWSAPGGARSGFGALLLSTRDQGKLHYNGKVGTGFNEASLKDLSKRLAKLKTDKPAVENPPRLRDVTWVRPELVCEVEYTEMTRDGSLRHPSFQGLREDKPAAAVTREQAAGSVEAPMKKKTSSSAAKDDSEVAGVRISNPDRVMDEKSGVTKLQLAQYHKRVSGLFLRYAAQRPLALVRCPQGGDGPCFFQKHVTPGIGKSVKQARFDAVLIKNLEGVLQLSQFNVVEFHGWGALMPRVEKPDWIIFDLDPDVGLDWKHVVEAAFEVRDALAKIGLKTLVKTTGGKGLHVVAPIVLRAGWDEVKEFSHRIAQALEQQRPERYVANMAKAKRQGRIFVDYLRNGRGATGVLPYSPRARPGMHVAMPVDWKELEKISPGDFTVANVEEWVGRKDAWARLEALRSELPPLKKARGK